MKIGDGGLGKIQGIYKKQRTHPLRADKTFYASGASSADKIELSTEARDFQVALKALGKTDYVREWKVEDIKAKIASGKYNVSAEEVAEKMVDSLFFDKKV